ncbi:MAG: hypothetical protein ACFFC7_22255 [Candidatus Hermodarchaeota archaeon]
MTSMAITAGSLSDIELPIRVSHSFDWINLSDILNKLPSTYKIIDIYPDYKELLLEIQDPASLNPEEVRNLLQALQEKFFHSFVALINMRTQSILITVRG